MDFRQLRYFMMVADEHNFTRAAARLHIAQPPLSRQIHALEEELGSALFDRDSRPLRLTSAGQLFYEQANQILSKMEEVRAMMSRAIKAQRRRFSIGFVGSTIYARLPGLIRSFRKMAPEVDLQLVEIGSLEQISALKEGLIDVGFGRIRFDDPAVRRTVLREEELIAAVPLGHPLTRRDEPVPLARLAQEPLIVYPRTPRPSYADQVISHFHDYGFDPSIAYEAREMQTAIGMVAAEEGVCVVPFSARNARSEDVSYLPIAEAITSPIIMSHRMGDGSLELGIMALVVQQTYEQWGYAVPETIARMAMIAQKPQTL